MRDARAKSRRKRPLRELNRGTGRPGVEDVSTPAISSRARRRTQKEVHGSVRTRPVSERLTTAFKTPGVMSYHAWPSPCRPSLATVERGRRQLTDEERTQLATAARFARHTGTPSIKELAREWRISPKAIYEIINRQRSTGSAAALPRSGRPNTTTDVNEVVLAELSEELDGEYTWEEMTERFNERTGKEVSKMTVFRFCKSRGWRERGASLEDAEGVLPCSLPHSLPR
jgi:transposase